LTHDIKENVERALQKVQHGGVKVAGMLFELQARERSMCVTMTDGGTKQ
jgi:hypothetical protein